MTLVFWGGQLRLLLYTLAYSGSLGWSAMVPVIFPRAPIVYPSQLWFAGVVSQGSYCIPQLTLVRWGGQPGFLLYTLDDSGLLGWSAKASIVYPSLLWFVGVVSQGPYYIPQPTLVCWGGQPGFLLYTPDDSGLLGWSARFLFYTPTHTGLLG